MRKKTAVDETSVERVDGAADRLDEPRRVDNDQTRQQRVVREVDESTSSVEILQHQCNFGRHDIETARYRHDLENIFGNGTAFLVKLLVIFNARTSREKINNYNSLSIILFQELNFIGLSAKAELSFRSDYSLPW